MSTSNSWYAHRARPVNPVTASMTFWSEICVNRVLSTSDKARNKETGAEAPSVIIKITCPTLVLLPLKARTIKFMAGNAIPAISTKAGNCAGSTIAPPTGGHSKFAGSKITRSGYLSDPVSASNDNAKLAPAIGTNIGTIGIIRAATADAIEAPAAAPPTPTNFGSDSILMYIN